jgi:cell division protein FtsB
MREFQAIQKKHEKWKKIIHSPGFLFFLCICIFFLSKGLFRIYHGYDRVHQDFTELQSNVTTLQQRNAELDMDIQRIESSDGKDYEIRKKLDVAKPGEKTLYIVDTP